jgi:hemerythrin
MAFLNALSDFDAAATGAVTAPPRVSNTPHKTAPAGVEPRAPFFRWREHWCVGIEALDRDHRALAAILNHMALRFGAHNIHAADAGLRTSAHESAVPTALRYWLDALRERAREHFAREEALMRATHYPDTAEHASEHALMLAEYTALVRDICARGDEQLRLSDLEALKQWLLGHMLDMDKRLACYLRENGVTALPLAPSRQADCQPDRQSGTLSPRHRGPTAARA